MRCSICDSRSAQAGNSRTCAWRVMGVRRTYRTGECRGRICLNDARLEIVEGDGFVHLRCWRPIDELTVTWDLERQELRPRRQRHRFLRVRIHGMLAVLFIPIRDARVVMHVLDDLPPADAGVVGAE